MMILDNVHKYDNDDIDDDDFLVWNDDHQVV